MFQSSTDTSTVTEESSIQSKILKGELVLRQKKGRSKVWEVFSTILDLDGKEVQYVSCNNCKKILKHSSSTSNLVRHKCYICKQKQESSSKLELDESSKKTITKLITKWAVRNCRPYNIVADSGLEEVLEHFTLIGSKYGSNVDVKKSLPHPTTVSRNVENLYRLCFQSVREEISSIKETGFSITSDLWTDDYIKKTYIAATIHFVKDGVLKTKLLGLKSMEGERCTSKYNFFSLQ